LQKQKGPLDKVTPHHHELQPFFDFRYTFKLELFERNVTGIITAFKMDWRYLIHIKIVVTFFFSFLLATQKTARRQCLEERGRH
jgi:hypothetical protein